MYNLSDIGVLKKLLFEAGFSFKKSLGQNFLINPSVCPDMAEASGCRGIGAIEIGPGVGVLTTELCRRAEKVVAVEIDERLRPILNKTLGDFQNCEVVYGDVMKLDLSALIKEKFGDMPVVICANLPYYITSPIVMMLLESRLPVESVTVMVQKEAADRLAAEVGSRMAGAVTVAVSYYAKPSFVRKVSRGSFMPAPKVDSAVIKLDILKAPPVRVFDEGFFFRFVRAGFSQRRKTLCNAVSSSMGVPKDAVLSALKAAELPENTRTESLTMEELAAVSTALCELTRKNGTAE